MQKLICLFLLIFLSKAGAQAPALNVADSLYAVGNYADAIISLEAVTPVTGAVNIRLARSYQAKGKFEEAKAHYEKVLE